MPRYTEKQLDTEELSDYLLTKGAATTKEIKETFETSSRAARLALYELGLEEDVNLICVGGHGMTVYWMFWGEHQKGRPNPVKARSVAEKEFRRRVDELKKASPSPKKRKKMRVELRNPDEP